MPVNSLHNPQAGTLCSWQ